MTRRIFSLSTVALATVMPILMQAGGPPETRLRATLAGARIDNLIPSGHAEFRAREGRARLNVQVEDVKVAVGSILDVSLDGNPIGTITVEAVTLGGELELNSQDGAMVPTVAPGSLIVVRSGERAIVAGVF